MNILIAGGTGFIGTMLVESLHREHAITVLSREKSRIDHTFGKDVHALTWDNLMSHEANSYDAVINLCGHNIADSRWNETIKKKIIESRVQTNQALIEWLKTQKSSPHFYCANAVGIYGIQKKDDPTAFDEDSPIHFDNPTDFLNEVGARWQQSLQPALDAGIPVTITRFGVVLKRGEGLLKKLSPSFNLGLGSVIGDGKQIISWVHSTDVIRAYEFLLNHQTLLGPFNVTSPNPVPQKEFAKQLAHAMHRPLLLKTPEFVIRLLFGEMGECLINQGQRVKPKRLPEQGFTFAYPNLPEALAREFDR